VAPLDLRGAVQENAAVTALTDIEWEAPFLEPTQDRELERYVRQRLGMVPTLATYFYSCPWIVRSIVAFDSSQLRLTHVDDELARLIGLVVSQDNSCRYCYAASRALLKIFGFGEMRIRQLEQDLLTAELSPNARVALDFVRRVSRANPLPAGGDTQKLRAAGYGEGAVKELVFLAAINVYYNRLATLPAIPTEALERMERSWVFKLLRPLIARFLTAKWRAAQGPAFTGEPGPYAYLVDRFAGVPLAATLAWSLHEAWQPSLLPARTKAFAFAVVARGLGCPTSEREATRLLVTEGVDETVVRAALDHLASPALNAVEAAIVPFARETIWYSPVQIQRRARALREQLTREQFLELVGVVSLANAVCRMSPVLALR
jgi:alkylhydroperoxidase family enzyme